MYGVQINSFMRKLDLEVVDISFITNFLYIYIKRNKKKKSLFFLMLKVHNDFKLIIERKIIYLCQHLTCENKLKFKISKEIISAG